MIRIKMSGFIRISTRKTLTGAGIRGTETATATTTTTTTAMQGYPCRAVRTIATSATAPSSSSSYYSSQLQGYECLNSKAKGSKRYMSDNLLGYNPMSNNTSVDKNASRSKPSPTAPGTTGPSFGLDAGAGAWAKTTTKRDKLGELRLELDFAKGERTLDDAASNEERLDLWFADGLKCVVRELDLGVDGQDGALEHTEKKEIEAMLVDLEERLRREREDGEELFVTEEQFRDHLTNLSNRLDVLLQPYTSTSSSSSSASSSSISPLAYLRDFTEYDPSTDSDGDNNSTAPPTPLPTHIQSNLVATQHETNLSKCRTCLKLLHLRSTITHLLDHWTELITPSDADIDRAAAASSSSSSSSSSSVFSTPDANPPTLPLRPLHDLLHTILNGGGCQHRVEALWKLLDHRDNDGMLDAVEMERVAQWSIEPYLDALGSFVERAWEVWPLRHPARSGVQGEGGFVDLASPPPSSPSSSSLSSLPSDLNTSEGTRYQQWKIRRNEQKTKKVLQKLWKNAVKNHFEVEIEMPHRLRCVYAWAEKQHQDGKVESVLVDGGGGGVVEGGNAKDANASSSSSSSSSSFWTGRKRYVELDPKISYGEFRDVQEEHFPHLDRVGEEICKSFRDELHVSQGTRRQNKQLKKEVMGFMVLVSLIDAAIFMS